MALNEVTTPRFVERIQRAELGGSPASNDEGFGHGASVWIVEKRQLLAVLYRAAQHAQKCGDEQLLTCLQPFFEEDTFVFRGDDLPARPAKKPKKPKCPPLPVVQENYCLGCGRPGGRACSIIRAGCGY